jgi:dolichol-phosphate mannosyltransferase
MSSVATVSRLDLAPLATPRTAELAVVVPTFKEAGNIAELYQRIAVALDGIGWEMIVVDDNSPDGTADVAWELGRTQQNLRCIKRVGRRGLSSAVIEGMLATGAPFVAVIDGDLQHDETILPALLAKVRAGADISVGTRYSGNGSIGEGFSAIRAWGSRTATKMSSMLAGQDLSDPMSGFFMVRRDLIVDLAPKLSSEGFKILLDLIITANRHGTSPAVAEVPYTFRPRHTGESKMSPLVAIQFAGLWLSKLSGGILPTSFLLFSLVGFSGIAIHLTTLWFLTSVMDAAFIPAQLAATILAMTWNFFLNNVLTYADRKLRGWKMLTGLLAFYAACSIGALANVSVAALLYDWQNVPLLAGFAGALMSSVFNYSVTRVFTWR